MNELGFGDNQSYELRLIRINVIDAYAEFSRMTMLSA